MQMKTKGRRLALQSHAGGTGRVGAERAFVRFDADSEMVRSARDAGFFPYQTQVLHRLEGAAPAKRRTSACGPR